MRTTSSSLKINVAHLLKSPSGSSAGYLIDEYIGNDEIDHVWGDIILTRSGQGIMVRGKITANIKVLCSRCLTDVNYTTIFDVEDEFLPEAYILSRTTEIGDFDTSAIINNDNILDLSEIIRQCVLLSIPIKPLCSQNCYGLCTICGQNLNESICACLSNSNVGLNKRMTAFVHPIERRTPSNGTIA